MGREWSQEAREEWNNRRIIFMRKPENQIAHLDKQIKATKKMLDKAKMAYVKERYQEYINELNEAKNNLITKTKVV